MLCVKHAEGNCYNLFSRKWRGMHQTMTTGRIGQAIYEIFSSILYGALAFQNNRRGMCIKTVKITYNLRD